WLAQQPQFTAEWLAERLAGLLDRPADLAGAAKQSRTLGYPDAAQRLAGMVLDIASAAAGNKEKAA
ncbi:MAG: UDP-N-acetylglucosamine--N-acetylmuramyl-(pentapeptide) pyrophosphoryl-undecaprenol N-acetylglucosamine transferase, partial [Alphaproteobacteria bacterium]